MKSPCKRISFLLPSLGGGGAMRVIVMLLQRPDRSRFEPHLALLEEEKGDPSKNRANRQPPAA